MIDRQQLARACRDNDFDAEHGEMEEVLRRQGFTPDDAAYVSLQRALRMYGVMMGSDASKLTLADLHESSPKDLRLISALAAAWTDGLAAGARAVEYEG